MGTLLLTQTASRRQPPPSWGAPDGRPHLYEWDIDTGAGGVTDDRYRAFHAADQALRDAPTETTGVVRSVWLVAGEYLADATLGHCRHIADGIVLWTH